MPPDVPVGEQAELYERFSDAAAAIERNEDSAAAATRARELYQLAGRPLGAAGMLLAMSIQAGRDGAPQAESRAFTKRALDEIDDLPESTDRDSLRAFALSMRANDGLLASELAAARADAEAARELAEAVGDRETVLEADLTLARIDIVDGRHEKGLADGMRAAREAREAGFEAVGVTGYRNIAMMATRVMDPMAAELALGEGLQYADAIEQSHCRQMMATTAALLDWGAGRWDAADERARHELVDRGCRRGTIGSLDVVGLVALGRGRADEARRWLEESLTAGRRIGEVQFIMTPLWALAEVDLQVGHASDAVARCEEGLDLALTTGERALLIPFVVTGTRAYLAARRPEEAERWRARVADHLAGWDDVAGPALAHADGLLRLAAGSILIARDALEAAAAGMGCTWPGLGSIVGPPGRRAVPAALEPLQRSGVIDRVGPLDGRGARQRPADGARRRARQDRARAGHARGAVAAIDRPRVRSRPADRRGHDQRRDRR